MSTLGDLFENDDVLRSMPRLARHPWIVRPESAPKDAWSLLVGLAIILTRQMYFTKRANWIEPPITAVPCDLRNDTAVVVGATNTTIVTYTIPDKYVGSFLSFGHGLTVPAEWGNVIWNIFRNGEPVVGYREFLQQIGTFVAPSPFVVPMRVKHGDVITVTARTAGAAVSAYVRMPGFLFPARELTQDGSYDDYMTH
jgi:hypothetical protein